jgi:periodic tryptophan protein 1
MAELDMEHYDDDEEDGNGGVPGLFGDGKHPGMAYYSRPEEDPYLARGGANSDSEEDVCVLKMSDLLILAARNEDDVSHLEVLSSFCSRQVEMLCSRA